MSEEAIEQRRDLARKTFEECPLDEHDCTSCSRDRCIEVATQVRITDAMLTAIPNATRSDAYDIACDLFTAAGFEVIE